MMLEETGISGEVELLAVPDGILIRRLRKPRSDWEAQFKTILETEDDTADWVETYGEFERTKWQW